MMELQGIQKGQLSLLPPSDKNDRYQKNCFPFIGWSLSLPLRHVLMIQYLFLCGRELFNHKPEYKWTKYFFNEKCVCVPVCSIENAQTTVGFWVCLKQTPKWHSWVEATDRALVYPKVPSTSPGHWSACSQDRSPRSQVQGADWVFNYKKGWRNCRKSHD